MRGHGYPQQDQYTLQKVAKWQQELLLPFFILQKKHNRKIVAGIAVALFNITKTAQQKKELIFQLCFFSRSAVSAAFFCNVKKGNSNSFVILPLSGSLS